MPTETAADLRTKALADWEKAVNDQSALLRAPSQRIKELTDQARQAQDQGVISVIGSNCGSTRAMMNAFYCLDVQYC